MSQPTIKQRIDSIDALRGLVIILMLLDHVRERFFYNHPVSDPMDIANTEPALFWSRFAAHFCAPIFVFLTGLSAWLYQQKSDGSVSATRDFLWKRGLFLVLIEVTLVNFSWFGAYETLYLQVIWAIGISMLVLSVAVSLPRTVLLSCGLLIVVGHNALGFIEFKPNEWGYTLWSILHDRGFIWDQDGFAVKASYPVLPWIGVILLGYATGPIYGSQVSVSQRTRYLLALGILALLSFAILRVFNIYGETQAWSSQEHLSAQLRAIFNVTKYPPSLNFLQITLAGMCFALVALERFRSRLNLVLSAYGGAPMFFYIVHLYILLLAYLIASSFITVAPGTYLSVPSITWVWLITAALAIALYWPTRWFNQYKRRSQQAWLKYF